MNDTKALVAALRASDFAGYRTGEAADLIEQQAKELDALRKAILNQCGSELAESIEIEAHHAK